MPDQETVVSSPSFFGNSKSLSYPLEGKVTSADFFQYPWALMTHQGSASPKKGVWGTRVAKEMGAWGHFGEPRGDSVSQSAFAWLSSSELQSAEALEGPRYTYFQPQLCPDWGRMRVRDASTCWARGGGLPACLHWLSRPGVRVNR